MRTPADPKARHLVLAGGGHSHALVLRMLGMKPLPGVRLTLISDVTVAPYSGMLPGHIAGYYSWDEMHIDLRRLCEFAGAAFIHGEVSGIDVAGRRVLVPGRPAVGYDVLSVNIGSTPQPSGVRGVAEYAIPAKPVPQLLAGWERIKAAGAAKAVSVVITGGGAGGVELALCMQRQLSPLAQFTIVHRGPQIMDTHNRRVRNIITGVLHERGIRVLTSSNVAEVRADSVLLAGNPEPLPADFTLWVTQASPAPWLAATGMAVNDAGFLRVTDCLQSVSHPDIFAAGDVAVMPKPVPRSGVYAVRMARPLLENLRRHLSGEPLIAYAPQRSFLSLIGTADEKAVASRRHLASRSVSMWRLKDWIDRRFMRKFSQLPKMDTAPATQVLPSAAGPLAAEIATLRQRAQMRCLGCAAKVGSTVLSRTMQRLRAEFPGTITSLPDNAGIDTALDAPDDAAVFKVPPGRRLVQTVDYMPALIDDPFLFGKIAALHCFSDIFAMGADPHSCLVAALLPFAGDDLTGEMLYQLLAGVLTVLRESGAFLIGGHTAEGDPMALALTCNGLVWPDAALYKGGLRTGDALILTKALGTGTLFAAAMRLETRASWIDSALASMLISNLPASRILRAHGVTACTDVTGFGLAGHLVEMLRASHCRAVLQMSQVPVLPGAVETTQRGILSSLHGQNASAIHLIANAPACTTHEKFPLLFDPQTSGGLLAGVPVAEVNACLDVLHHAGCKDAAIVGRVTDRTETTAGTDGDEWIVLE